MGEKMKYFAESGKIKTQRYVESVDFSRMICDEHDRGDGGIISGVNFSSDYLPWLGTRRGCHYLSFSSDYDGVGIYDGKLYYVYASGFYYNGALKFGLSSGKKFFRHFKNRIYVFPDALYYEPSTGSAGSLRISTGKIQIKIQNRILGDLEFGLAKVACDGVRLSSYFRIGDRVDIVSDGWQYSGQTHKIKNIVESDGTLIFESYEFGMGEDYTIEAVMSNGMPESCECACVSRDRLWVTSGNKIFATSLNDESYKDDKNSRFLCQTSDDEDIMACLEFCGSPVFFTGEKIYVLSGNDSLDFSLDVYLPWCGLARGMEKSVSLFRDSIFYISRYGIAKFDGADVEIVGKMPFSRDGYTVVCFAGYDKYYVNRVSAYGTGYLYAYDPICGLWSDYGSEVIEDSFIYNGAVCTYGKKKLRVIDGYFNGIITGKNFIQESIFDVEGEFQLDAHGNKPTLLKIECKTPSNGSFDVEVYYDGERGAVGTIPKNYSGVFEMSLIPQACHYFKVALSGKRAITIKKIEVVMQGKM